MLPTNQLLPCARVADCLAHQIAHMNGPNHKQAIAIDSIHMLLARGYLYIYIYIVCVVVCVDDIHSYIYTYTGLVIVRGLAFRNALNSGRCSGPQNHPHSTSNNPISTQLASPFFEGGRILK